MKKSKKTTEPSNTEPAENALKSLKLQVNTFGEIVKDIKTEAINAFLNDRLPDKKFQENEEKKGK